MFSLIARSRSSSMAAIARAAIQANAILLHNTCLKTPPPPPPPPRPYRTRALSVMVSLDDFKRELSNENNKGMGLPHHPPSMALAKKKKSKKTVFACTDCGFQHLQWQGICRECKAKNTVKEICIDFDDEDAKGGGAGINAAKQTRRKESNRGEWIFREKHDNDEDAHDGLYRLSDISSGVSGTDWRIPIHGNVGKELGKVLGGGIVPGSLILIGGDPGVGKSTLLLQLSSLILGEGESELQDEMPSKHGDVLYVSGEESVEQIANRAVRLCISSDKIQLFASNVLEEIIEKMKSLRPKAIIVDSIQTIYLRSATGTVGSLNQVKECATALLLSSKTMNIPVFLVGHVTKSGDIAGPRALEHIVDVVLYMEAEAFLSHRLIRPIKNRFGSTDELGVFEMTRSGLQTLSNPSMIYVREHSMEEEVIVGSTFTVIIDGSRPFLVEAQALCSSGRSNSKNTGFEVKRADMIVGVLMKQVGIQLDQVALYLNIIGGSKLSETVGDLAIAVAICSSYFERSVPLGTAFLGEIGLGGELRTVSRMEKRVQELAKLGFKQCIVPESSAKTLRFEDLGDGFHIVGHNNVKSVIKDILNIHM